MALAIAMPACSAATAQPTRPPARIATADGVHAEACSAEPSPDVRATPILTASDGCPGPVAGVLYRCEPRLDPVIAVGDRRGRDFLGGRFATPVSSIASAAVLVGEADGMRVFLEPGRDGRLFVTEDGVASRWLPVPERPAEDESHAFVLGDSIALGSADEITGALPAWSTTIDAVVGRPSSAGVPIAESLGVPSPSAVVVELGTNDQDVSIFARSAREILRALDGERLVVWVAPHAPSDVTSDVRRAIGRIVGRSSNAIVADWDAAVPADALASDGVHLLPERTDEFADFLSPYLRAWRMAVAGAGATSCVPSTS